MLRVEVDCFLVSYRLVQLTRSGGNNRLVVDEQTHVWDRSLILGLNQSTLDAAVSTAAGEALVLSSRYCFSSIVVPSVVSQFLYTIFTEFTIFTQEFLYKMFVFFPDALLPRKESLRTSQGYAAWQN